VKKLLIVAMALGLGLMAAGSASADDLEKGLQRELTESRDLVAQAAEKLKKGLSFSLEIANVKAIAEEIRASHLLMQERFRQQGDRATTLGTKAFERQNAVSELYGKVIDNYLTLIDALPPDGTVPLEDLGALKALLDRLAPPKKRPLLGTLPYKHLGYPAREPVTSPSIVPACRGGSRSVDPADTSATAEAPISKEITELAQFLKWNPVLIYEWVKNNVETEWYWGVMKGAEETMRQRSGNDADQAALLTALLRASGFPTRYIKGTIEFFPAIEKVKNLTGIDDPLKIAAFFQKAGVPFKPLIAGGRIANFQVEHIWVESLVPYSNYRGAVIDDMGKSWVALDTSIKAAGYQWKTTVDVAGLPLDSWRDEYLGAILTPTPLEYVKGRAEEYLVSNSPGKTWQDLLETKTLVPEVLNILPASLQFREVAVTGEYTELPADLRHRVKFTATSPSDNELFSITLDALRLSNQRIALWYEPETVEDQQIIDDYGGLDNTPSYLVRLRPVLKLNGERLVVAQDGLAMGADYTLTMEVTTSNGSERIGNTHIAGNLAVIGIVSQLPANTANLQENDDAETLLFKEASSYIQRWNRTEDELAAFLKVAIVRPIPTIATVGGIVDVTYLLDIPHGFEWRGVFMDAALRGIEAVTRKGDATAEMSFMRLSALQGSMLENRVFEDDLQVESISTAKLLQIAAGNGTPLLTVDKASIDAVLPTLPFDDNVKSDISNAVNQNLTVKIPEAEIRHRDWSGIGYVKENPETGESGWILSGMIAGGMTALNKDLWQDQDRVYTIRSSSPRANANPESIMELKRITDYLKGIAGEVLESQLIVVALDEKRNPVRNVPVTFRVVTGGGLIKGVDGNGRGLTEWQTEVKVKTGIDGKARVQITMGEHTSDSPYYVYAVPSSIQVGQNLVSASTPKGSGLLALDKPVEVLGYPGETVALVKVGTVQTDNIEGHVNTYSGPVWVKTVDRRGNPISNKLVTFVAGKPESLRSPPLPVDLGARLFEKDSECPGIATQSGCDANLYDSIEKRSDASGAWVGVVLGDTDNTRYPVSVKANKDILDRNMVRRETSEEISVTFNHSSYPVMGSGNRAYLAAVGLQHIDENGNRIEAGTAGMPIRTPLETLLFVHEEIDRSPGAFRTTQTASGRVDYNSYAGGGSASPPSVTTSVNGAFAAVFAPGPVAGLNRIAAQATATVQLEAGETRTLTDTTFFRIWGVKPDVVSNVEVYVNSQGYPEADVKIPCSVNPADYKPYSRYLLIYEDNAYMGFVPVSDGYALLSRGGAKFDIRKKYSAQLVLNWMTKQEIKSTPVPLNVTTLCLIPDYDHNRRIDYADRQRALNKDTYYFWVNDDDGHGDTEGTGIPGSGNRESNHATVGGTRDLIDWFPVHLDLGYLLSAFGTGGYTYKLRQEDGYLDFVATGLNSEHAGDYLTGSNKKTEPLEPALSLANAPTVSIPSQGHVLSEYLLQDIKNGKSVIMVEAWKATRRPLVLEIADQNGHVVFTSSLKLSIDAVEQMFRNKSLTREMYWAYLSPSQNGAWTGVTPVPDHPVPVDAFLGSMPDRLTVTDFSNRDHFTGFDKDSTDYDTETGKKNDFVHVHGYNVNGQEARGEQAEVFKRLYWSGSRARFWGVTWFGWDSQFDMLPQIQSYVTGRRRSPNYHANIRHAFNAGKLFKWFAISQNLGKAAISAHSLGNMVVSTAIQEGMQYGRYLMLNAAVAEEAYIDANVYDLEARWEDVTRPLMYSPDWRYPKNQNTEYKPFLWQSEWYQLFRNTEDERYRLTWRNNFSRVRNSNVYAYYASTDEAFRPFKLSLEDAAAATTVGDAIIYNGEKSKGSYMWTLIQNWLKLNDPEQVGTYAFSFNELMKGTEINPYCLTSDSKYGGWGFNENANDGYYTSCIDPTGDCGQMKPDEANSINNRAILKTKPFFNKNSDNAALFTYNLVDNTVLTTAMRERMLANEIPALTFAVGHMGIGNTIIRRVNIRDSFIPEGSPWPRDYNEWCHSDFINMAYPYLWRMYDDLANQLKGIIQ
jgi:hypothetical protein